MRFGICAIILCFFISSCSSYQQYIYISEEFDVPNMVFRADFNQTWQAVLQHMKKYDLAMQNQEAGMIKTKWINNTMEMNFTDAFDSGEAIKGAQFKLTVTVVKGYRGSREVTKVTIYKRQMLEKDFLQGWRLTPSDGILEKTILYRIKQILDVENRLKKIEETRQKEEEEKFSSQLE